LNKNKYNEVLCPDGHTRRIGAYPLGGYAAYVIASSPLFKITNIKLKILIARATLN